MSSNNSPNLSDSASLRNLPQSFHFNPRMRSPGNNFSRNSPHRTNNDNPDFISFGCSSPIDNRRQPFRHFNKSPYVNRQNFRPNRSNFSTPNSSFNSSRNSSFSSGNNSCNSSQNYSPFSRKSSNNDMDGWESTESYRSMFGNPWASLENELKEKYGDKYEPLPNIAVHRKTEN